MINENSKNKHGGAGRGQGNKPKDNLKVTVSVDTTAFAIIKSQPTKKEGKFVSDAVKFYQNHLDNVTYNSIDTP